MFRVRPADYPSKVEVDRPSARYWPIALIVWVLLAAAISSLGQFYVSQFRTERMEAIRSRANVAAQALEQTLRRSLEAIESIQALTQTRENLIANGDTAGATAISAYLQGVAFREQFGVLQVATIGSDGWMTWATTLTSEPVWLGDRSHFLVHLHGERGMRISQPLIGRASGRWSVQVTRPLVERDGGFGGVTVVSFDPLLLSNSLAALHFGENSVSGVMTMPEGILIARSKDALTQLGRRANPDNPVIIAARTSPSGTIEMASLVDGHPEVVAYRVVGDSPLVVVVGLDKEKELHEVNSLTTWVRIASAALVLFVAALLAIFVQWAARQQSRLQLEFTRRDAAAAEVARNKVAQLLAGLPAAVYSAELAPDGGVLHFHITDNATRLTGWDPADLGEHTFWTSKSMDIPDADWTVHFRKVAADGDATIEYRFVQASGEVVWFRDQARVVERRSNGETTIVGYITDITTRWLMEAQASASSKLATLGEMATGLAHELNQPIAIMSLAAENSMEMLSRQGERGIDFAVKRLQRIVDQAARARTIVDHLRIFGRETKEELQALRLQDVVDGALTLVGGALRGAGVAVETALPDDLPLVQGQLVLAEHVLVNLLLNARDAMEANPADRPRRLTVGGTWDETTRTVALTVHDNGPGIPASVIDRIFEPFFTTKEVGKGTGLGLSICHGIMKSLGGRMSAHNAPEGGAVLVAIFRLPPDQAEGETADSVLVEEGAA
jgi:C4-dicarboxylate-specific signal transduction histidine kinase